jgi:thiamine transporter
MGQLINVTSHPQGMAVSVTSRSARTRVLAEAVAMIALATALYTIKIFTLPQGGSVTMGSMIPILLLAFRRGARVGVMAGAVFGILVLYLEPFVYNPVQFLLDYPLAFGSLGLAGFFKDKPMLGASVGIGARFVCHFFSGAIFFASFAPVGENPSLYSAIYNGSYLLPELAISAAVMWVLLKRNIINLRL